MSAQKPLNKAEQFLIEESESLSQILYNKPFNELDEVRQARITASAKRALKDQIFYDPQPGECFSCHRVISQNQMQCTYCHDSIHPTQKQLWREKSSHLHPSEIQP